MGVIHGPAGLGKTFAVTTAVDRPRRRLPVSCFEFPGRTTTKAVVDELLAQITGISHPTSRASASNRSCSRSSLGRRDWW